MRWDSSSAAESCPPGPWLTEIGYSDFREVIQVTSLQGKKMLAITAHPDDDMGLGAVLTHYAARGVEVHLVCATAGQKGFRSHVGVSDPSELARIRKQELHRACEILKIEPPTILDFVDQELLGSQQAELKEQLHGVLQNRRPDVVLTFGPDGITGHPDHRAVSCLVTELLQRETEQKIRLFYLAFTRTMAQKLLDISGRQLAWVADRFIDTVIEVSAGELAQSVRAISQYKSQFDPEAMGQILEFHRQSGRKAPFREGLRSFESWKLDPLVPVR